MEGVGMAAGQRALTSVAWLWTLGAPGGIRTPNPSDPLVASDWWSCLLTIEGHEFPLEGLELVQIAGLQPYILGSRRFEAGSQA
jgi:hypothetical protein